MMEIEGACFRFYLFITYLLRRPWLACTVLSYLVTHLLRLALKISLATKGRKSPTELATGLALASLLAWISRLG